MTASEDDKLDALVREHFAARLDPHSGRPAEAFARHVRAARRRRLALSGAAFCCAFAAAMWGMFLLGRASRQTAEPAAPAPQVASAQPLPEPHRNMGLSLVARTIDDGTVACGRGVSVRQLRREVAETAQWIDAQRQARVSLTLPRRQIIVYGVEPD